MEQTSKKAKIMLKRVLPCLIMLTALSGCAADLGTGYPAAANSYAPYDYPGYGYGVPYGDGYAYDGGVYLGLGGDPYIHGGPAGRGFRRDFARDLHGDHHGFAGGFQHPGFARGRMAGGHGFGGEGHTFR